MSSVFVLLLLSILNRASFGEVAILDSGNFTTWIDANPATLVMFYAPWCSHSKTFAPAFDYIDQTLSQDKSITLAKVNCVDERELYWSEKIENFPTLKAYIRGEAVHYKGEREIQDVVDFIRRLSTRSLVNLEEDGGLSVFESNYLTYKTPVVVLFVQNIAGRTSLIDHFDLACKKMATLKCAVTIDFSPLALSDSDVKRPTVAVIRSFEKEAQVVFTTDEMKLSSSSEMLQFIQSVSYPNLVKFSQDNDELMFSDKRPGYQTHILLIVDPAKADQIKFLDSIRLVAAQYNGQCVFIHIDPTETNTYVQSILSDIVIPSDTTAAALIIKSAKTEVLFYRLDAATDVNIESVSYWLKDFFADKLVAYRVEKLQSESS